MGKSAVKERSPEAAAPAAVETGACRHHWIIESPRGALSDGRCKICGEERQFRNSASDYIWDDDSSSGYGRWGSARPAVAPVNLPSSIATLPLTSTYFIPAASSVGSR